MIDYDSIFSERPGEVSDRFSRHINHRFARVLDLIGFNKVFTRGSGAYLWDQDGRKYLDFLSGYSLYNVGRNHPRVKQAVIDWLERDGASLVQMESAPLAAQLGQELARLAPGELDTCFFTSSGSETTEVGLKMARKATGRPRILYADKAFHGLTFGALSVTDGESWRQGFEPLLPGTHCIPFDDLEALEDELRKGDVAAFITEPIQGEAGVRVPSPQYLPEAAALCHRYGALLILDEIQTGIGRTGRWFACEHWGVEPDIMLLSKGLSGGYVPIGAMITRRNIFDKVFTDLRHSVVHTTTFGGNAMAMVAGLASLRVIEDEHLVENAEVQGALLRGRLQALACRFEMVKEVRGLGLMIGIEFAEPQSFALKAGWKLVHGADEGLFGQMLAIPLMRDYGILTQVAGHNLDVHKLAPPLIIGKEEVTYFLESYEKVLDSLHHFPGPIWDLARTLLKNSVSW
ncbi:MAG TPA: aspartate aminotransferase family protein [Dehalococcoidia bacterium]|nr:aspartate aminotransferase family protein [Dehalococcoidia bacterium]